MVVLKFVLLLCLTITSVLLADAKLTDYEYVCKTNVSDINTHKPIGNLKDYCKDLSKPCISKCCGMNEVLYRKEINGRMQWPICASTSSLGINVNYARLKIYKTTAVQDEIKTVGSLLITDKNFLNDFYLVRNGMVENEICADLWTDPRPFLLENGMFASDLAQYGKTWMELEPDLYCVDLNYVKSKNGTNINYYIAKEPVKTDEREFTFNGIASLISSIFLVLVLMVYCVLPQLRNLSGMLLMAYVATLLLAFIIKAILVFFSTKIKCAAISAMFYFFCLSSFFWLSIMSFDIWWTFRGQRLKRAINRRGELVKFGWYSLYGWGAPLALTIVAAIIDSKRDELPASMVKPMFDDCMILETSVTYYLRAPTGVLTSINIVLFLMTVYNIWLIKKKLDEFNNSNSNKKNENRLYWYLKISVLMGSSWLLDIMSVLYENIPFWAFVLINLYNNLIGVVIFIMFILNGKTLGMLCKRYNVQCRFIEAKKFAPNTSRSTTKSSINNGSYNRPTETAEDTDVEMYDVEVSTNPNPK